MSQRDSLIYLSFRVGTWWQTQVRISPLFLLVPLLVGYHHGDLRLGVALTVILFLSVLVHEFGHVVAARRTGGSASEIIVWPFGGLAFVQTADTLRSQILTPFAGPIANGVLFAASLLGATGSVRYNDIFYPLSAPAVEFLSGEVARDLMVLTCWCNWVLILLNLIPVFPFDGGRILHALATARLGRETGTDAYLRVGMVVGVVVALFGLVFSSAELVLIGGLVVVFNLYEAFQLRVSDTYDESFMGYDFSQGYTSLERSNESPRESRKSAVQRWRERRKAEKDRKAQEREQAVELQLDAILEKVHASGMSSLSDAERRLLERASARFRDKAQD